MPSVQDCFMMTKEDIRRTTRKMHRTVVLFMAMALSGVAVQSILLIIGGLIGAIASSRFFASKLSCPLCGSSLYVDPRTGESVNFCPGCSRSLEDHHSTPGITR